MGSRLAIFMVGLMCILVTACGGARTGTAGTRGEVTPALPASALSSAYARTAEGYVEGDDDQDHNPSDDRRVRSFGNTADALDARTIAALIRRYLAVAVAGDGRTACVLLDPNLARRGDLMRSIPYDYALGNVSALRNLRCPQFMSRLFQIAHAQLALAHVATMKVVLVRVEAARSAGLAVLAFKTVPERQIAVRRVGRTWKLASLLDEEVP